MVKYILLAIILCLSMLGLAEFLHGLKIRLTAPEKRAATYLLVFLSEDNAERQIMSVAEQRLWLGGDYCERIIAVNTGLSDESDRACRYLAGKYGIYYCTPDEFNTEIGYYLPVLNQNN